VIAVVAVAFLIGKAAWDEYQDSRCDRILMELDKRDSQAAVDCFERFSSH